eukprot:CAMPEP_0113950330 /NCGR_PEP_ID=MMETSP1339-20121228/80344_1 /TAXON_ID=94617 /ORGANISM="Fibrocapsa japonica" /LENGTH=49 /DNA_ID=CAMNT_0000958133 /DNA_START=64 /DNA_END=213 /DNA_ORIENTATION=+ /assembly_acc=CAM_ASM_000762
MKPKQTLIQLFEIPPKMMKDFKEKLNDACDNTFQAPEETFSAGHNLLGH